MIQKIHFRYKDAPNVEDEDGEKKEGEEDKEGERELW